VSAHDADVATAQERAARGKAARAAVPRSSIADYEEAADRPDPIALLEEQAESRVPELVPIRYGRMLVSPFTFFRGAALIMASDLARTPTSGLIVQACGDAHLCNFGAFASPERRLLFDVNDFDETLPAPWEWDLKRLAASLAVAGRDRGFSKSERAMIVATMASAYRTAMAALAALRELEVWYRHIDVDQMMAEIKSDTRSPDRKRNEALIAKARTRDSMQAFAKLTHIVGDERRIIHDPPLIVPAEELDLGMEPSELTARLQELLDEYSQSLHADRRHLLEQFRLVHIARKVVGVGSVGTRAWVLLLLGRDDGDPLFLQAKEAQHSVLERFVGEGRYSNQGERVVAGQRLIQAASDIFLGWEHADGVDGVPRDYYIRQLRDWKASADVDRMLPEGMANYGRLCGWTLARGHARSGDRIAIASYLGKNSVFDQALAAFAETYADQNERDYERLKAAAADGRVLVESGV
jgi:uncharacterized protein (DUF2252 family)